MESLYKKVLKFTFLTLFQLLVTATSDSVALTASTNCLDKCGNMNISYPFGIKDGCFRPGFQIICDETTGTASTIDGIRIKDISLSQAQMRIYNWISYSCNHPKGGINDTYISSIGLSYPSPFKISHTRNKFTAVGCQTLAYMVDGYIPTGHNVNATNDPSSFATGCLSLCTNRSNIINNSTCLGIGCCEVVIPSGLTYYNITFDPGFNNEAIWDYSPCSFAFVAEDGFYSFLQSDTENINLPKRYWQQAPVVLDWVLGNEICKEAKLNKSGNYACVSSYSYCIDSKFGYTCNCGQGFEGNPYIHGGCTDVDECKNFTLSQCYGNCTNLQGSYTCTCPVGYEGKATEPDGCRRIQLRNDPAVPIYVIVLIASLSTFLVAAPAIMYVIHGKTKLNRAKKKYFRQNERLLLQEQINSHESVRFRIFSIKEIMKATNNFEEASIKGRGGQGIVYEGIIGHRPVAIKKSIMIDEKRVKEFVKEMYILSLINHKNVVQILGYCLEVEVPILVYEFISRGTLYQRIQQKNQKMSLGYRLQIAIDSASALAYLHYDSFPPIIHGDVKSSNILLDENNVAKISDFGASMFPLKDINEIGVPGTFGYLDPESLTTGQLTKKSDVYSFAVVFLELLTRMKAVYFDESREKRNLAETFKEEGLEGILDEEIKYVVTKEQIREFLELLNNCLKNNGSERPTMKKVLAWLLRIQEFDPKLSEESEFDNVELVTAESSNHNPYTTQFYSLGHRVLFGLDYNLTRENMYSKDK